MANGKEGKEELPIDSASMNLPVLMASCMRVIMLDMSIVVLNECVVELELWRRLRTGGLGLNFSVVIVRFPGVTVSSDICEDGGIC